MTGVGRSLFLAVAPFGYKGGMRRIASLLVLAALLAGCSRPEVEFAPVTGRVFYHGRPLAGGTIVFTPDTERGTHGPQATAEIGADGRFTLRTAGKEGAVAGWHRITIASSGAGDVLPGHYRDPDLSRQGTEVKVGRTNHLDLHLE